MKYLTKDWYELSQKTDLHLLLKEEEQAEVFSEEYFQLLYSSELRNWFALQEEVAVIMGSDAEGNREDHAEYEPFDKDKAAEQFHKNFISNQADLKRQLPEHILKQIADLRVFTLDKASHTVIEAVTQFCEDNERSVTAVMDAASNALDKEVIENFGFHDCTILETVKNDKSLVIRLDNTGGFTNIDEVRFHNCNVIEQDGPLEGSWWLYEEVYKVGKKYEFHALLQGRGNRLIDFIVSADQVSFKSVHKKRG